MKIVHYSFAFTLLLLFATGCGNNVAVTGKVTFPDGTPLHWGQIVFETPTFEARGAIQEDGTYALVSGEARGIPPGNYRVYFDGFEDELVFNPDDPGAPPRRIPAVIPVAAKYRNPGSSELTCEIQGRRTFDVTVERP